MESGKRVVTKVLLYSGGMDSEALRLMWKPDLCVYIRDGSAYNDAQLHVVADRVEKLCPIVFQDLGLPEEVGGNFIVPFRNLYFICAAVQAAMKESPESYSIDVALGATAGDRVRDKSLDFARMTGQLLTFLIQDYWNEGQSDRVNVRLPFKGLTKRQIVEKVAGVGHSLADLDRNSFSCYTPNHDLSPCHACKPCYRKWVALACNGHYMKESHTTVDYIRHTVDAGVGARGQEDDDIDYAITKWTKEFQ